MEEAILCCPPRLPPQVWWGVCRGWHHGEGAEKLPERARTRRFLLEGETQRLAAAKQFKCKCFLTEMQGRSCILSEEATHVAQLPVGRALLSLGLSVLAVKPGQCPCPQDGGLLPGSDRVVGEGGTQSRGVLDAGMGPDPGRQSSPYK